MTELAGSTSSFSSRFALDRPPTTKHAATGDQKKGQTQASTGGGVRLLERAGRDLQRKDQTTNEGGGAWLWERAGRDRWTSYLLAVSAPNGPVSPIVVRAARKLWTDLADFQKGLPVPQAGPTSQGGLLMIWDVRQYHFEIEVSALGDFAWFYADHATGKYEHHPDGILGLYHASMRRKLKLTFDGVE